LLALLAFILCSIKNHDLVYMPVKICAKVTDVFVTDKSCSAILQNSSNDSSILFLLKFSIMLTSFRTLTLLFLRERVKYRLSILLLRGQFICFTSLGFWGSSFYFH
jgi:hypothetical protein